MAMLNQEFKSFRQLVERHHRFVITTHINPDGDGIGSELALAEFLRSRGKSASIINHSATPPQYSFLDPDGSILRFDPTRDSKLITEAEVIVVADANQLSRLASGNPSLREMEQIVRESDATKVCIDHHLDKEEFAGLYIIDESSAATGQIVYSLLMALDYRPFPVEVATSLYVAILTDTGSFRFPKTTGELHRVVAQLIEWGADPVSTYQQIYEQGSPGRLRLLGRVLGSLQTDHFQKVAHMTLTREMFRETGTSEVDAENFINYTLMIEGVQIGLLISEFDDGVKISFRSKGDIPINKLAQEFGGNGHKNAAGAQVPNATAADILLSLLEKAKNYITS